MRLRAGAVLLIVAALAAVLADGVGPPASAAAAPGRVNTSFPDAPDPHVLRTGGRYFAYTTNRAAPWGGLIHVPVWRSGDLASWSEQGDAFPDLPRWAVPGHTWAPAVAPLGGRFVLFFSARERRSGRQCIGKAFSNSPTGPFRDTRRGPVVCQRGMGGSIDPYVFRDRDGRAFLLWKNDGNCCGRRVSLWSQLLRPDSRLRGRARRLVSYDRAWESPLIENPAMVRSPRVHGDYRLFYAANWWESKRYGTGFARCDSPRGPCRKVTTRGPWHESTAFAFGPGGAAFFTDGGGRNWMALHGWARPPDRVGYGNGGRRSLFIEKVDFSMRRPRVNTTYPYAYHRDAPHPFVDVPAWADDAVAWAWGREIVTGLADAPDRTFLPARSIDRADAVVWVRRSGRHVPRLSNGNLAISRGQAVRLLYTAAGEPNVDGPGFDHDLTDVPYALRDAVRWAVHDPGGAEAAVASGYPDHTFRPRDTVNRANFLNMLWRFRTDA